VLPAFGRIHAPHHITKGPGEDLEVSGAGQESERSAGRALLNLQSCIWFEAAAAPNSVAAWRECRGCPTHQTTRFAVNPNKGPQWLLRPGPVFVFSSVTLYAIDQTQK